MRAAAVCCVYLPTQFRFELVRIAVASLRRDAMDEQAMFSCTLALQARLDTLLETMPARFRDALQEPFSEGRRFILELIVSRSMWAWLEMFLHGRHYAQGWTDPTYDVSRRIFFRAALFFIQNFLAYWDDLVQRFNTTPEDLQDLHHLLETSPGLMYRATPLARMSFTLLAQLERHGQLAKVYPDVVSDEEREQEGTVEQLAKQMHHLHRRFAAACTFDEFAREWPSPIPTPQVTMPSLPVPSSSSITHAPPIHHHSTVSNDPARPAAQLPTRPIDVTGSHSQSYPGHLPAGRQDLGGRAAAAGQASAPTGSNPVTELDSHPFSLGNVPVTDPLAGLDLDLLLQVPELDPMFGNAAAPFDESGMPLTFEDLFLSFNPVS